MGSYVLAFKPVLRGFGMHDPSAVIFEDGHPVFGIEEERLSRNKHAPNEFPVQSIRACLAECEIDLSALDEILIPYDHTLLSKLIRNNTEKLVSNPTFFGRMAHAEEGSNSVVSDIAAVTGAIGTYLGAEAGDLVEVIETRLDSHFGGPVPPISTYEHHACHAASAYYPAPFTDGLVVTLDGKGEYDSTVVWRASNGRLTRERTYGDPNSLGFFYAAITEFLGYRAYNGEGKIMGLAAYGQQNDAIEETLYDVITPGVDYDVTEISTGVIEEDVQRLERLFDRPRKRSPESFTDWEKDLACTVQQFLEATLVEIVETYTERFDTRNVGLAGGVALNCKLNKRIMDHEAVETLFVQPLAHDGGLAFGAGLLHDRTDMEMHHVYYGPGYSTAAVRDVLEQIGIAYREPADIERTVARHLADGDLVGWFQGRLEMGPRALGNRSILADPRTPRSRDRVNVQVKHREQWRPFAPSILESAADRYLVDPEPAPFMIKSFDVTQRAIEEIPATLHPEDQTTRPQTVSRRQNPRYYDLLCAFEDLTGVPAVLNTSFNDSGEPIVTTPREAIKDFFGMGLDVLAIDDFLVEKTGSSPATLVAERSVSK